MVTGTTPGELDRANGGNFASGKLRILGLEIDDQLAHRDRERAMMILSLGGCLGRKRLIIPWVSKAAVARRKVLSATPVSSARSAGGIPNKVMGRMPS